MDENTTDIDLRLLRYLTAVVEERSFTRAADRLGITQPALSRAIRSLETAVGASLLTRGARGVKPTAPGEVLLEQTRGIPARIQAAVRQARALSLGDTRLRLITRACDVEVATEMVATYQPADPSTKTHIEIRAFDTAPAVASLREGECDVALLRDHFDTTDLDREPLWAEPRVVLLSTEHPLVGKPLLALTELHDDPITVWAATSAAEQAYWAGADEDGHRWREGPRVASASDVLAAVRLNQAVAFVPVSQAPADSLIPGLCSRPVTGLSASTLYVTWLAATISPQLADFVRHATDRAHEHLTPRIDH